MSKMPPNTEREKVFCSFLPVIYIEMSNQPNVQAATSGEQLVIALHRRIQIRDSYKNTLLPAKQTKKRLKRALKASRLTAAGGWRGITTGALGYRQPCELLGCGGMYAYCVQQCLHCQSGLECCSKALNHFPRHGTNVVQP